MKSIFKTFILSVLVFTQVHFAYAQTASILPPAKTTFFDQNGKPLTNGSVEFFIPGTTTHKNTWQDSGETNPNTNPVVLDPSGRAIILGDGSYRQIVKDRNSITQWDQVTSSIGGGGTGGTTVGDGNLVGTILPWSSPVIPANYVLTYGQELSRSGFPEAFAALTLVQNVTCVSGNATITTIADTTQLNIGAAVEAACLPASSHIVSKTSNTVTLDHTALVSTTNSGTFFPYGNGNGVSTFNVPDFRGDALLGRCNMGGSNCSNLTNPTYTDPNALYGSGGNQTATILATNLPPYTPAGTIANGAITSTPGPNNIGGATIAGVGTGALNGVINAGTITVNSTQASSTFTGTPAPGQNSTPIGIIQPSKTINYIIKVSPNLALTVAICANISDAGTACKANTGSSLHTVPFLDVANTWSANQTFSAVAISGGSFTGLASPVNPTDAATKAYVDTFSTGLNILAQTGLATAAILPNTPTYANGASGVGATLTAGSNTTLTVDGTAAPLGTVVLVKNQASAFQNGIYTVTTAGSGAAAWVLTRATYFDQAAEMKAASYTFITGGATNTNSAYTLQTAVTTVGTDALTFILFSAGNGVASVNGITAAVSITAGAGISVTPSAPNVAVANTGVLSVAGAIGALTLDATLAITGTVLRIGNFLATGAGAVARTIVGKLNESQSVTDYGAVCNGTTDDTTAIASAIAANANGRLTLPPNVNCKVKGSGSSIFTVASPIMLDCQGSSLTLDATVPNTRSLFTFSPPGSGDRLPKRRISHCLFDMNGVGAATMIIDTTATNTTEIGEFEIDHVRDTASGTTTTANASILVNNVGTNTNGGTFNVNFHDNVLMNGIYLNSAGDSIRIINNILSGSKFGVYAALIAGAGGLTIIGNNISAASPLLIDSSDGNTFVSANEFEQQITNTDPGNAVVDIRGGSASITHLTFTGNSVTALASTGSPNPIKLSNVASAFVETNTFSTSASVPCIVNSGPATIVGASNKFTGCSSNVSNTGTLKYVQVGLTP